MGGYSKSMELQQKSVVQSKLLNRTKNRTQTGHVLSNNGLCQHSVHRACHYFFLVLVVNSDQFWILQSYTLLL